MTLPTSFPSNGPSAAPQGAALRVTGSLAGACLCAALVAAPAGATPLTLTGDYLQVGISDYGTFGSNGSTEPGLLHDPAGTRNFSPDGTPNDYLTPGTPHDGFAINSTQTGFINNDNSGRSDFGMTSPTLLTGAAARGYDNAATWTSSSGASVSVTNSYFFNAGSEQIRVITVITALTDLTNVAFGRSEDPDPDVNRYGTFDTVNTRGDSTTAPADLVSAAGQHTGLTIGILNGSGGTYVHNTAISGDCCSNEDPYSVLANTDTLAYPTTNLGDYGLQIAWALGDLAAGQSRTIEYSYVFGTRQGDVSTGGGSSGAVIDTTSGDLAANVFSLGSAAAQASTVVFEGGILRMTGGSFPGNVVGAPVTIDAPGGTVDTSTGSGGFSGPVSGPGAFTLIGGGTFSLTGANSYAGGTTVAGSTLALGTGTALGTGAVTLMGGTLQALADGLTLANALTLSTGGVLDTQGFTLTYAGAIAGDGSLSKAGTGTLVLPTANTYGGGTTLLAGVTRIGDAGALGTGALAFAGGTLQAGKDGLVLGYAGTVTGAGAIDTQDYGLIYAGAIGGAGALTKLGTGTLVLTGANSYAGGTTIAAGTLQIGAGGTSGSLAGNVLDNGVLAFDRADDIAFAGTIAGSGALAKFGAGTLTLGAASSYGGGTTVHAGTLAVADSAALGTGPVSLDEGTTLRFVADGLTLLNTIALTGVSDPVIDTGDGHETISGAVTGPGALTKRGSGVLDLTGVNTYTGPTTVAEGTLLVDGAADATAITVAGGAALGGMGSVGAVTLQSGGAAIMPTAGGTLTVRGNLALAADSTYQVTVNADGTGSRLAVGGAASLNGATLSVLRGSGSFTLSRSYTILSAAGGVAGTFGTVDVASTLALLTPTVSYTADSVLLNLRQNDFRSLATTGNQAATAGALQALGSDSPLFQAVLGQDAAGARQAFTAASGLSQASTATVARSTSIILSGMVLDRLWDIGGSGLSARQVLDQFGIDQLPAMVRCYGPVPAVAPAPPPRSYTAWGEGFGSFGHSDGGANAGGLDRSLGGFILGVDTALTGVLDGWRAGVAAGYTETSFTSHLDGSAGTVQGVFGSLYGGARYGAVDIRLGTTLSGNSTDDTRRVAFPGFLEVEKSSYGGLAVQGFGEVGYRIPFARAVLEPVAGAAILHVHQDGFTETGGAAALTGAATDNDIGTTTLGFRGEVAPIGGVPLMAHAFLGWQHTIGNVVPTSVLAFAAGGGNPFTVSGAPIDRDALSASAALDYRQSAGLVFGVSYTGLVGEVASEHAVKGKVEVRF